MNARFCPRPGLVADRLHGGVGVGPVAPAALKLGSSQRGDQPCQKGGRGAGRKDFNTGPDWKVKGMNVILNDMKGLVLASSLNERLIGKNTLEIKDPNGKEFVKKWWPPRPRAKAGWTTSSSTRDQEAGRTLDVRQAIARVRPVRWRGHHEVRLMWRRRGRDWPSAHQQLAHEVDFHAFNTGLAHAWASALVPCWQRPWRRLRLPLSSVCKAKQPRMTAPKSQLNGSIWYRRCARPNW